jgi:hypothetical protein
LLVFGSITGFPSLPCTSKQTRLVFGASSFLASAGAAGAGVGAAATAGAAFFGSSLAHAAVPNARSEERRVGKECY